MSQQLPSLKIKLNVKKEPSADVSNATDHGVPAPAQHPGRPLDADIGAAVAEKVPLRGDLVSGLPGATKPIKLKVPLSLGKPAERSARDDTITGARGNEALGGKRPAAALASVGAPKKIKLGGLGPSIVSGGFGKIKLKAPSIGTPGGEPSIQVLPPVQPMSNGLPAVHFGSSQQPFALPKKRGRKPKAGPGRPPSGTRRICDEVKYNIAAPPPRAFSLRATASQGTLHTDPALSIGMDTAGTAPAATGLSSPPAVDQIVSRDSGAVPVLDACPPTREDVSRLLNRIWDKDSSGVFRQPVTDEEAPDYSKIITRPMDLSSMRRRVDEGAYSTWDALAEDLHLMFTNALTYNIQGDTTWKYAQRLQGQANIMLRNAREGRSNARGRGSASVARQEAAAAKAAARREADQARAAARAEQRAAQEQKVLKKAGIVAVEEEENTARITYRSSPAEGHLASWGGLGGGASAEGVALGWGRQLLRPYNQSKIPNASEYASSLLRYARRLKGKAKAKTEALAGAAQRAVVDNILPRQTANQSENPASIKGDGKSNGKQHALMTQNQDAVHKKSRISSAGAVLSAQLPGPPPLDIAAPFVQSQPAMAMAQNARAIAAQVAAQTSTGLGMQPGVALNAQGLLHSGSSASMSQLPYSSMPAVQVLQQQGTVPHYVASQPPGMNIPGNVYAGASQFARLQQVTAVPLSGAHIQQHQQQPR